MAVYTYARYSTDRQTEVSIVDQQRRCHEYATSRSWSITADFTDEGISGAALGNRPGFQQVLTALQSNDVLLCADLTRLSRSQELAPLLDRFRSRSVSVIGVLDGFDSTSPQARMQAGLSGLMSDELRAGIRIRTHSALEMRAKGQRATGGKVYGYDSTGKVIDTEANVVGEIFERTALGDSMRTIANSLNARGIPSPGANWNRTERRSDGRWLTSALNAMLQNERYIGRCIWNRSTWIKDPDTGRRIQRDRPESEWVITDCPALVSPDVWAKVAIGMRERATGDRKGHGLRKYLLSGLLVCEHCGARFIIAGSGGAYYACGTHQQGGSAACPVSATIPRKLAEQIVLEPIKRELLSPEAVKLACERIRDFARAARTQIAAGANPAVAAVSVEIADLEALIEARPARGATLRPLVEELRTKQAKLLRTALRQAQNAQADEIPAEEAYRAAVADMAQTLRGSNIEAARAAVRQYTGSIPVFQKDGKLYGRMRLDSAALFQSRNPEDFGSMVAGA
jgi:site-specific DNA recombinase